MYKIVNVGNGIMLDAVEDVSLAIGIAINIHLYLDFVLTSSYL